MIKHRLITLVLTVFFATGTAIMSINAQAQDVTGDVFDESQYSTKMESLLTQLQEAHEMTKDPNNRWIWKPLHWPEKDLVKTTIE